jgi:DNA (cytosine-5)-methyltransferase 1
MTTFRAYYNENDRHAAEWLRNLIKAGLIAPGEVDGRDIQEVVAADIMEFTRCHFFAGIAGWDYALRLAGWPRDRHVWTASCPCQPFSAAGRRKGRADERHLWPVLLRLVKDGRPSVLFGEQVAGDDGYRWLARIRDDLEEAGYAVGAADLPAACAGAPHVRQRLFWVAHLPDEGRGEYGPTAEAAREVSALSPTGCGETGRLADADGRQPGDGGLPRGRQHRQQPEDGGAGRLADAGCPERGPLDAGRRTEADGRRGRQEATGHAGIGGPRFWNHCEWLPCADGKARRVEPGLQPLVDGVPFRLADGRTGSTSRAKALRGIGNAIVPAVAALFVRAFLEAEEELAGAV